MMPEGAISTASFLDLLLLLASLLPFYLLGAFPTGHLVARSRGVSIEEHGSGNVGATNVLRTLGKKAGAITFIGDFLKGLVASLIGTVIGGEIFGVYTGAAAVLGHCFSIPGKMKGGKGVATAFGVFTYCSPIAAGVALGCFLVTLRLGRMVSLASIVAALSAPLVAIMIGANENLLPPLGAIGFLIVWRHRSNIQRIIEGRERTTGGTPSATTRSETPPLEE